MGKFWITKNHGVWWWLFAYLGMIITFACLYSFLPDASWKGDGRLNGFVDCIYFSVVTITSLGYGDIYPNESVLAKIFVSAESIAGILIIGLFLNDVAHKQAIRLDERNRKAEEEKSDLYSQTFLKSSDFYEPAINAHFRNQDIMFNELRSFITSVDLGYWPELEERIYHFILLHHQFQFQDVIVNNGKRTDNGKKLKDDIRKAIANYEGELNPSSGDLLSPYVALYYYIQDNAVNIQHIYKLMEKAVIESQKNK